MARGADSEQHDAVVIGAGPAGLAVAAALGARGIDATVLERSDAVGSSWRAHYEGLRLNSMRVFSNLPGLSIPRRCGRFVLRDDFVAYLEAYASLSRLDVRFGCGVDRIDRDGTSGSWRVTTSGPAFLSGVVIVATSFDARAVLPEWATGHTFSGDVLHSSAL